MEKIRIHELVALEKHKQVEVFFVARAEMYDEEFKDEWHRRHKLIDMSAIAKFIIGMDLESGEHLTFHRNNIEYYYINKKEKGDLTV